MRNNTKKEGEGPPKSYDYTSTARAKRRREWQKKLMQSVGYRSVSTFLTDWKNGKITVTIERIGE